MYIYMYIYSQIVGFELSLTYPHSPLESSAAASFGQISPALQLQKGNTAQIQISQSPTIPSEF